MGFVLPVLLLATPVCIVQTHSNAQKLALTTFYLLMDNACQVVMFEHFMTQFFKLVPVVLLHVQHVLQLPNAHFVIQELIFSLKDHQLLLPVYLHALILSSKLQTQQVSPYVLLVIHLVVLAVMEVEQINVHLALVLLTL